MGTLVKIGTQMLNGDARKYGEKSRQDLRDWTGRSDSSDAAIHKRQLAHCRHVRCRTVILQSHCPAAATAATTFFILNGWWGEQRWIERKGFKKRVRNISWNSNAGSASSFRKLILDFNATALKKKANKSFLAHLDQTERPKENFVIRRIALRCVL